MTKALIDLGGALSESIINSGSSADALANSIVFNFEIGVIDSVVSVGEKFWLTTVAEYYFGTELSIWAQEFILTGTYAVNDLNYNNLYIE